MAREKTRNIKKRLLIAICVIFVIAGLIAGANVLAFQHLLSYGDAYAAVETENKLVPQKDENGYWYFTTDGEFNVMHLTDIHIGGGFLSKTNDEKALNAVAAMITREKPDLVIATGDITFPVPYETASFNNYTGIAEFANLMESLGVYWTVTFGNHDAEGYSYFNREKVSDFYQSEEYTHCLYQPGPDVVDGFGNHVIEVKNSEGLITQAFIMIDSQAYVSETLLGSVIESIKGNYDNIHPNQVQWYRDEISRMNAENKAVNEEAEAVSSLAFFHIPLAEKRDAWLSFQENGYQDTDDFRYIEGIIGEQGKLIYCGTGEDDLFEAMTELGSTKAMFHGHDHLNNTTFEYKGIVFSYGYSIDYLAYSDIDKQGSQRGCTMITCMPDSAIEIAKYNYYSDRYALEGFTREEVTMQHEDVTYQYIAE